MECTGEGGHAGEDALPAPRAYHSLVALPRAGAALLFGGWLGPPADDARSFLGDLWALHAELEGDGTAQQAQQQAHDGVVRATWRHVALAGPPPPRAYHAAEFVRRSAAGTDLMLVFGGFSAAAGLRDDLHALHVDAGTLKPLRWETVRARGAPPAARAAHSASAHEDAVYIFGGDGAAGRLGDVARLDCGAWPPRWEMLQTRGEAPAPRSGHAAAVVGGSLVVVGGVATGAHLDDVCALDLRTLAWYSIEHAGSSVSRPLARSGHVVLPAGQGRLVVFGGWNPAHEERFLSELSVAGVGGAPGEQAGAQGGGRGEESSAVVVSALLEAVQQMQDEELAACASQLSGVSAATLRDAVAAIVRRAAAGAPRVAIAAESQEEAERTSLLASLAAAGRHVALRPLTAPRMGRAAAASLAGALEAQADAVEALAPTEDHAGAAAEAESLAAIDPRPLFEAFNELQRCQDAVRTAARRGDHEATVEAVHRREKAGAECGVFAANLSEAANGLLAGKAAQLQAAQLAASHVARFAAHVGGDGDGEAAGTESSGPTATVPSSTHAAANGVNTEGCINGHRHVHANGKGSVGDSQGRSQRQIAHQAAIRARQVAQRVRSWLSSGGMACRRAQTEADAALVRLGSALEAERAALALAPPAAAALPGRALATAARRAATRLHDALEIATGSGSLSELSADVLYVRSRLTEAEAQAQEADAIKAELATIATDLIKAHEHRIRSGASAELLRLKSPKESGLSISSSKLGSALEDARRDLRTARLGESAPARDLASQLQAAREVNVSAAGSKDTEQPLSRQVSAEAAALEQAMADAEEEIASLEMRAAALRARLGELAEGERPELALDLQGGGAAGASQNAAGRLARTGLLVTRRLAEYQQLAMLSSSSRHVILCARAGRKCVLKEIALTGEEEKRSFENEVDLLWKLRHPSVVPVEAVFYEGLRAYIQMPYVEGGNMKQWAARGGEPLCSASSDFTPPPLDPDAPVPMPPPWKTRAVFRQLLQGLAFLHDRAVTHCDLKLENVLMTAEGRPLICDLGISEQRPRGGENASSSSRVTAAGATHTVTLTTTDGAATARGVKGTVGYISPEVLLGRKATHRSDMYALGIMLWRVTFPLTPPPQLSAETAAEAPQPVVPQCDDEELRSLLVRLLSPRPRERLTAAEALALPYFASGYVRNLVESRRVLPAQAALYVLQQRVIESRDVAGLQPLVVRVGPLPGSALVALAGAFASAEPALHAVFAPLRVEFEGSEGVEMMTEETDAVAGALASRVCAEAADPAAGLFDTGDAGALLPAASAGGDAAALRLLEGFGRLLARAVAHGAPLPLPLAPAACRYAMGQPLGLADVETFDTRCAAGMRAMALASSGETASAAAEALLAPRADAMEALARGLRCEGADAVSALEPFWSAAAPSDTLIAAAGGGHIDAGMISAALKLDQTACDSHSNTLRAGFAAALEEMSPNLLHRFVLMATGRPSLDSGGGGHGPILIRCVPVGSGALRARAAFRRLDVPEALCDEALGVKEAVLSAVEETTDSDYDFEMMRCDERERCDE